jgi:pimeloyl-ACP methyl ester carboxylesterase
LLRVAIGLLLIAMGVFGLDLARPAERAIVLGDACRTPAHVLGPVANARGVAVVFHGLAASEAIMQPLGQSLAESGWRVYLLDLAGHGSSLVPFSYARVNECAASAVDFLYRTGHIRPGNTVFVGHSLGGAVVVHLADDLPVAATVAISPAPLIPPVRMPSNLLVLAGQFDLGPVKKMARELLADAGGTRTGREDFIQRRAAALHIVSGELHGTMVLDPRVWKLVDAWASRAIGSAQPVPATAVSRPLSAMLAGLALLAGMVMLVGPAETVLAGIFHLVPCPGDSQHLPSGVGASAPTSRPLVDQGFQPLESRRRYDRYFRDATREAGVARSSGPAFGWRGALLRWAIASFSVVSLLALLNVTAYLRPVRLADGDWAALVALLTGVLLVALAWGTVRQALRFDPRGQALAAAVGIAVVVAFALALRPEFVETSFHFARIWRWAVLVVFTWPYFLAEEAVLGDAAGRGRFYLFLGMRGLIWLAELYILLIFWRWGLLLVLLAFGLGAVSIGQRLAADALRRRGASPTAAALFDAILAAGMLALFLPLA